MAQRGSLHAGFLLMGFTFTVTQSLLIRELLVAFFGNELSIGLILGNWLILEAIGSGLLGHWTGRRPGRPASFALLQLLLALLLPLCALAAHLSRRLVGAVPGAGVGLVPIFWSSFVILAPLALVDGAMFAFGCRAYARLVGEEGSAIGRVYILEAAGGILGGLVFTYLFIPWLAPLPSALVLSALNLLSSILIVACSGRPEQKRPTVLLGLAVVLLVACVGILFSPLAQQLQRWAVLQQWPGFRLLYSENSIYGNVAAVERDGQYTFFADGIPMLNVPVPDVAASEEVIHLPLLFVREPRRALVLSGGLGGVLHELGKYPLEQIDYAELDPLLIQAVRQFPTPLTEGELADPRLRIEAVDGRWLVRTMQPAGGALPEARYDLVVIHLPYPSTLQLNRFYTVEFFQMVRRLLADDGIVVLGLPGSQSYLSEELRGLHAMTYRTLRAVFPHVRPIPGESTLWLASPAGELLAVDVDALVDRWTVRGLATDLVSEPHIRLRLDQRVLDWFWTSIGAMGHEGEQPNLGAADAQLNRDLHPVGLFHGLSYWNALFSPALARIFAAASRIRLWTLALPLLAGALLAVAIVRSTGRGTAAIVPAAVVATGFTGMAADLVIILSFQTLYGHVYHWVGLLLTAFMAGLALGGRFTVRRRAGTGADWTAFVRLEGALVLFWALLPLALAGLYARASQPGLLVPVQAILFALNVLAGLLVGAQFPLANRLWLQRRGDLPGSEGVLYACDLVGAFLGAILVSVLLIPVLGIVNTCLVAAVLKLCSLVLVATSAPRV